MSLARFFRSRFELRVAVVGWTAMIALATLAPPCGTAHVLAAQVGEEGESKPLEGRLWNLADKPFTFRLRRRDGVAWSDPITVAPHKYFALRVSADTPSELEGITGKGTGHVSIEYPELGGKIRLQLPAQDKAQKLVPYWFHVKDANGFSRLVQAKDVESAEQQQAELQKEPKLTPQEVAGIKRMLKANWVLFD